MTRRIAQRIKQLEIEADDPTATPAGLHRCAHELLDLARSLRQTPPAVSRNDPVGMIERLLTRRANARADAAEYTAARVIARLSPSSRAAVLGELSPRLTTIVPALLGSDASTDRLAGLTVLAETGNWSFVPHAAGIIGRASSEETTRAIEAIACCAALLDRPPLPEPAAFERALAAVLDAASQHGTGSERRVLAVALLLFTPPGLAGQPGRGATSWLEDAPQAIQLGLRASLRALEGPLGVARAFELLVKPELRRASAERVSSANSSEERRALLCRAHLGRRPLRRSALRARLEPLARARLAAGDDQLDAELARALPGWVELMGIPADARTPMLEPHLAHDDPAARLNAVFHAGDDLRLDQSLDASEPVARSAAVRIAMPSRTDIAHGLANPETRCVLQRSPHRAVRRLASRMPVRGQLAPISLVALRNELARQRSSVLAFLADRIADGDSQALVIASRLELGDELLDVLAETIAAGTPRAAASAAKALASAQRVTAGTLLERCLAHDDPRVRANAVEAASTRARRWGQTPLLLALDDPHHRPASNSIRAQITSNQFDESTLPRVQQLLTSAEPGRRAAGLWLTERTATELKPAAGPRWAEIAARVAESARKGESAQERKRATRCARRMLAVTNA